MIIKPRKRTASAPVASKQPEPQPKVEKKPERKEEIRKISSQNRVKKILEELEEESSHEE